MCGGCDWEEMFIQMGGTTYLSCACFVGHSSSVNAAGSLTELFMVSRKKMVFKM